jgi:hypothetical protein
MLKKNCKRKGLQESSSSSGIGNPVNVNQNPSVANTAVISIAMCSRV